MIAALTLLAQTGLAQTGLAQTGLAQTDDSGLNLPSDGAGWIVWLIIAGIIVGLYLVVQRTRERAEREYFERKRREEEQQRRRPDLE